MCITLLFLVEMITEASLDKVVIGSDPPLENVPNFDYLGSRLQGDGSDDADVRHRLEIAQSAFSSLSHLWADHRLSRTTKLRLYRVCVCSSLTHCCEAWTLNRTVKGMVLYSAVSSPLDRSKRFTLSSPGRPVHSDTVLGFSWKHSSHAAIAQRLFTHISTTVYSQVLIYTAESTEAA